MTWASRSSALARSVPSLRERQRPIRGAEREVAAHAGGQVQHDVDPGVAHPLHHLAVERRIARRLPGLRIAHVHVDDRGAGPGRIDAGAGESAPGSPAPCRNGPWYRPRRSVRR